MSKPGRYGVDAETGYPLCKNGHVRSPENLSGSNCKEYKKAYDQSEHGKARKKAYDQSEKGKASKKAYNQSEKAKLSPTYAAKILGIKTAQAPPELLEIKILTLKLRRILKCQNQKKPLQQAA